MTPLPAKPPFSPSSPYWLGARDIYQTMRHLGAMNPLAIAAVANADMESCFEPQAIGDHDQAYNLWQWWWIPRGARILHDYGVDVRTERNFAVVTGALWWEMTATPAYAAALKQMRADAHVDDATGIFCQVIEGAGAPEAKERRMTDGRLWSVAIANHAAFFDAPPAPDE